MLRNGIAYILVSTFCFSLVNVCVKYLENIPTAEIVLFRSLVTFIITATLILRIGIPFWGNQIRWLLLRGAAGAVSLTLFFYTIKLMPIGTAVTIQFLSPIFTIILGIYFLGEKVKKLQWIFFILAFIGVIVVKGFDPRISWIYLGMGILSAFFSGVAYNAIVKCKYTEHPLTLVMYFPLVAIPVTGIWCLFEWKTPNQEEWILLLLAGLLTQIAQVCMTKSLHLGKSSVIIPFKYLGIIYALTYGFLFFNETYSITVIMGIILIVVGVVTNAIIGKEK
jgi:RarD protein